MKDFNYEQSVKKLEEIVKKLESSDLPLEEMLKLYEEGTLLAARCGKALDEAELKITQLTAEGAGDND